MTGEISLHVVDDLAHAVFDVGRLGIDDQLRLGRRLIRRRDSGEVGNLSGPGLTVEPLGIAPFAGFQTGLDENLVEAALGGGPRPLPVPMRRMFSARSSGAKPRLALRPPRTLSPSST